MSPVRELVANMPLSGIELKNILMNDFLRLLQNEGMLLDGAAFGRCSYEVRLTLHTDNHLFPTSVSRITSRRIARNVIEGGIRDEAGHVAEPAPQLAAVEEFPLKDPSSDASLGATEVHRDIVSPNVERLRHELPVPAVVTENDGSKHPETIKYPKDESLGEGDVSITDVSLQARIDNGLPLPPPPATMVRDSQSISGEVLCHCGHNKNSHALSGLCTGDGRGCGCDGFLDARTPKPAAEAWPAPKPGQP
jgi:hypothetical protein